MTRQEFESEMSNYVICIISKLDQILLSVTLDIAVSLTPVSTPVITLADMIINLSHSVI